MTDRAPKRKQKPFLDGCDECIALDSQAQLDGAVARLCRRHEEPAPTPKRKRANPSDAAASQSRMDETGWKKCGDGARCAMLDDRIEGEANARRKGFVLMVAMNLQSGDMRVVGVAYKTGPSDSGLMLNFCPFCGGNLTTGFIRERLDPVTPTAAHETTT